MNDTDTRPVTVSEILITTLGAGAALAVTVAAFAFTTWAISVAVLAP